MQMKPKNEKEKVLKLKRKTQTRANDTSDSISPKLELCTVLSA